MQGLGMLHRDDLEIETRGRGFTDLSADVARIVATSSIERGIVVVFVHHTSASLLINENADPQVLRDLEAFFYRLVPDGDPLFRHVEEGPDDMPAHVRAALTQTTLTIPIREGKPDLGIWQGIYLYEHRHRPNRRRVSVTVVG